MRGFAFINRRLALLALAFVLVCPGVFAQDRSVQVSAQGDPSISLGGYFSVLEDDTGQLRVSDVRAAEMAGRFKAPAASADVLNFGYSSSAYWLRVQLRNSSQFPVQRVLALSHSGLSQVEFHTIDGAGASESRITGEALPFATRAYPSRMFVFPLTLPAASDTWVYLRIQSKNSLVVPARLWEPLAFHEFERNDYWDHALYFGIATAMVLFNLLLFIALRDSIYLLYVVFVGCFAMGLASGNGLAQQFLWPSSTTWAETAVGLFFALSIFVFVLFSRRILNTASQGRVIDGVFKLLTALTFVMPLGLLVSYSSFVEACLLVQMAVAPVILGVGIYCAFKGQRSAVFFSLAFSMLVVFGLMTAMLSLKILPANAFTLKGAQIGSALEMLLLALALADRFNQIRREKTAAQLEALQAEQRAVETLRNSERQLEGRVQERTSELSATIEKLQKVQTELTQADKLASLGALVAGVAHELNTPIGNALTVATTLEESAKSLKGALERGEMRKSELTTFVDNAVSMSELVERSCHRAASLIGSFKQVAVDQTSEHRRIFELHALVEDNVAALRPSFRLVPWTLEVDIPEGIRCDSYPGPLGQVVANMIQNAAAHAFGGRSEGSLKIAAQCTSGIVNLSFTDDGTGMSAAVLARIFEPFYTTRLGQGGSGLGLSISMNIVKNVLGGDLQVRSQEGAGTCFTLTFPQVAPIHQPDTPPPH